jgi:hypothetical protein
MSVNPIKPEEVQEKKNETIPAPIVEVFNKLIVEKWDGRKAVIKQDEAMERVLEVMVPTTNYHVEKGSERSRKLLKDGRSKKREEIFEKKQFDIEPVFRSVGWKVTYDKPAYNETYPATFTFTK